MSEHTEVTKVVENVDRLFSQIVVNGEVHESDRYVPPEPESAPLVSTNQSSSSEEEQTAEQNDEPVQGEYVKAVELNNILHDFNDEELAEQVNGVKTDVINLNGCVSCICSDINNINSQLGGVRHDICCLNGDIGRIDTCIGVVQTDVGRLNNRVGNAEGSITCLQTDVGNVEGDVCCLQSDVGSLQTCTGTLCCCINSAQCQIDGIEELIPNQASCTNQLADKCFVNSSIASNTANFMGTYTTLADIEAIPNPTNNDYAFLQTTDSAGNTLYKRYKYSSEDTQWLFEYDLNNSSFTAEQWATINSGLTQSSVCSDISSAIGALDVASAGGSGKFISEVQQTDGKICATEGCISSAVTSGDSSPVSSDAVYNAIGALCAQASGGNGKYISAIQQTDGVVLATEGTLSNTVQSGDYAPVTSDAVAQAIAGAGISAVDCVVSGCMSAVTSNAVANGGSDIINNLSVGTSTPTDNDYYVAQYVGGGTTTTTYHRRTHSALWNYIKDKVQGTSLSSIHIAPNGAIYADGTCSNYAMIKFKDSGDPYGNGVVIGGGGAVVIGGGESADTYYSGAGLAGGSEVMVITNDGNLDFASNLQSGYACRKTMTLCTNGILYNNNGFSSTACISGGCFYTGGYMQTPVIYSLYPSASQTQNVTIYARCSNANSVVTTRTFTFCGSTGYMHGDICGNLYGTAVNSTCLGGKSVQTSSIGGTTTQTGNHWAYVTCAKFTSAFGYIVYSNGYKVQWYKASSSSSGTTTVTYSSIGWVAFSSVPVVVGSFMRGSRTEWVVSGVTQTNMCFHANDSGYGYTIIAMGY